MMTFPDTWGEYEKSYGFTDNEEVYTNGARLIPSFRVKQWLDHLPSAQPEYKPVKEEDFAKTMSENTLYSFMAWYGEALELMEKQGFVICKKTM